MKIGILIADFNEEITSKMEKKAVEVAKKLNVRVVEKIHVPGSFEVPIILKELLNKKNIDGVVTLGAVVQGDTHHDIVIVDNVSRKIMDLSLEYNKPVSLGIIGPRVSWEQADKRAEEYAERSVGTTVEMIKKIKKT